ncbi:MAG: hypothetical protein ACE366_21940 [Bradymonadia bacterium]
MRWCVLWMCVSALAACDDGAESDEAPDMAVNAGGAGGADAEVADADLPDAMVSEDADVTPDATVGPETIAAQEVGQPEPWGQPLVDYLADGEAHVGPDGVFQRGIHDLVPFDDQLFFGYGDATVNLGRVTPIEFRAFTDPGDPTAVVTEFASDEEQIDRFRLIDGVLYQAGIDATEDAWLGNVYRRPPGGEWVKHRTVNNGVHVHDVVGFEGELYAVGSGGTPEEWMGGNVYGHLWRSEDQGATWSVVDRVHNGLMGDTRWVRLMAAGGELYMFGYRSDRMGQIYEFPTGQLATSLRRVDLLPDEHPFGRFFATETDMIAPDVALLRGVDVAAPPLEYVTWRVDSDGIAPVEALAGLTLIDVSVHQETGEILLLAHEGSDFEQVNALTSWSVRVLVATGPDLEEVVELTRFETDVRPRAAAWWRGALYYGDDSGEVWRSEAR